MSNNDKGIEKILEDFRHRYYQKYNVRLDDELLFIFIRLNELNVSVNNDFKRLSVNIEQLKKEVHNHIAHKSFWDYFIYGLGKSLVPAIISLLFCIYIGALLTSNKAKFEFQVLKNKSSSTLEVKTNNAVYTIPLNKNN